MVSFFGLKLGGRKSQKINEQPAKPTKADLALPNHNFSRPQRPGTASSNRSSIFPRAPYAGGNIGAASSMVDLAAPRRPSVSSLRRVSSNLNLKFGGKLTISSPIGPPVSLNNEAGLGGTGGLKPGWASPLDVHFGKDMGPLSPKDSLSPKSLRSPLGQFDFGADLKTGDTRGSSSPRRPSSKSSDLALSLNTVDTKTTRAPSSLRRINTAGDSPATSPDDTPAPPNTFARRETMNFHSPRRTSFSKHMDEIDTQRPRTEQEKLEIKKKRQTEGFEGNFSAFNFGGEEPAPLPRGRPASPEVTVDVSPKAKGISKLSTSPASEPPTFKLPDPPRGALPPPTTRDTRTPSVDSTTASFILRPRVDSDTRAPGTPTPLRDTTAEQSSPRGRSAQKLANGQSSQRFEAPPKLNPDRRSQSPLRSKPLLEGNFPVSKGLPRGRNPAPISIVTASTFTSTTAGTLAPSPISPPPRPSRDENDSLGLPLWADRAERHLSAIPAPLTPLSSTGSMINDIDLAPWASVSLPPSPAGTGIVPMLPSPTFPSLDVAFSSSCEDLVRTLDMVGRRVEMDKAPPRPGPTVLPPSTVGAGPGTPSLKSPSEFSAGFI